MNQTQHKYSLLTENKAFRDMLNLFNECCLSETSSFVYDCSKNNGPEFDEFGIASLAAARLVRMILGLGAIVCLEDSSELDGLIKFSVWKIER